MPEKTSKLQKCNEIFDQVHKTILYTWHQFLVSLKTTKYNFTRELAIDTDAVGLFSQAYDWAKIVFVPIHRNLYDQSQKIVFCGDKRVHYDRGFNF